MKASHSVLVAALLIALSTRAVADYWNELQSSIRNAGDVDKDGAPELMIADPGAVLLVSGKTRSVLLTLKPPEIERVGVAPLVSSMESLGDVNADGRSDLVVCWKQAALACVYSGRDGRVLFTIRPAWRVAAAGDLNLDGIPDVLVGVGDERVRVCSGRDGSVLLEVRSSLSASEGSQSARPTRRELFGASLAGIGDTNGDGHGDFVVGAPGDGPPGQGGAPGAIELISGRDGRALARETTDPTRPENLGWSMVAVGDVDGDGACDVLVGALHRYAEVFSGKDLHRIHRVESRGGIRIMDAFASSLDRLGDVNGDGAVDWIIGANETADGMFDEGYAQVYSGKNGELLRMDFHSKKLGVDVCGLGDIDGDRVPDEAIACPIESWVRLLSGKDGTLIHQIDVTKLRSALPKSR